MFYVLLKDHSPPFLQQVDLVGWLKISEEEDEYDSHDHDEVVAGGSVALDCSSCNYCKKIYIFIILSWYVGFLERVCFHCKFDFCEGSTFFNFLIFPLWLPVCLHWESVGWTPSGTS